MESEATHYRYMNTSGTPTVLIVDDDDQVRQMLKRVLLYSKFNVVDVGTAEEGIAITTESRPDVVVADVRLPGMSGIQMVQRLRAGPSTFDVPVVLVSGKLDDDDDSPTNLQGTQFLSKPFLISDLVQRIRSLLPLPPMSAAA
jgi:DNA-binding response OmpR family regulator